MPDEPGRPAVVRWMPEREGPVTLYVEAVDQAGNNREVTSGYTFRVAKRNLSSQMRRFDVMKTVVVVLFPASVR